MGNNESQPVIDNATKDNVKPIGNNQQANNTNNPNTANNTSNANNNAKNQKKKSDDINSLPQYTMDEVEKHDTKDKGVWIVLNNLIYDVTKFLDEHPGGAGMLLKVAGEDGTNDFDIVEHSSMAKFMAKELLIARLKK